uniref:Reverse transcriptase N-terminal domain-containing protein n=1 Tax=Rhodomonas salina TaxID=3034 RepID=A6MW34_RHDSA|nr:hypothetical protein RhsaCp144 [Rhodomonas salina]ABO70799.1 unknown [Rhodomonas salina]
MDISIQNTSWKDLPWSKFQIKLFRLQSRICRAVQNGDVKKIIKIQKTLLQTKSVYFIAVKHIAELNERKVFLGHKKYYLTDDEKTKLALYVSQNITHWKHKKLQQISTTRLGDRKQVFFVSNFEDMVVQCVWQYALEPTCMRIKPANSCNPKINSNIIAWNIQKKLLFNLNEKQKKMLQIVVHRPWNKDQCQILMRQLIFPLRYKTSLIQALTIGILDTIVTDIGIPNNVISALLVDILLNGLEKLGCSNGKTRKLDSRELVLTGFRHGNNVVYMLQDHDNHNQVLDRVKCFLRQRGLTLLENKVTKSTDGFDFLDWCFVLKSNAQPVSYPSNSNWRDYKNRIKSTLKSTRYKIHTRIQQLKSINAKWYKYHQYCDMGQIRSQLFSLVNWCKWYMRNNTRMHRLEIHSSVTEIFNRRPNSVFKKS